MLVTANMCDGSSLLILLTTDLPLGLREDDSLGLLFRSDLCKQGDELVILLPLLAHVHNLQDVVVGRQGQRADVDLDVVVEELLGEILDLFGPGS